MLDDERDGERLVAVIDRGWLQSALAELAAHGIRPARAIVESALAAGSPGTWTVVWTGRGGFAALGGIEAIALDASLDGRPPLSLKLAADERRRRGDAPKAVRMLLAGGADAPDTGRWAESLHIPVAVVGKWTPEEADAAAAACPNLLPGAGGGGWRGARELAARFKPAAILAVGILAVHGVLTVADWSRLAYEARGLRGDMEAAFRKAFPEAKAVVDPALQMRRNVADLRRAAGEPDATDLVPVLAKLAPALAAAGLRPQSLRYERGELALDLAVAPTTRARTGRESAAGAGPARAGGAHRGRRERPGRNGADRSRVVIERAREWWQARAPRERLVYGLGAGALVVASLWAYVWLPVQDDRARLAVTVPKLRAQAAKRYVSRPRWSASAPRRAAAAPPRRARSRTR